MGRAPLVAAPTFQSRQKIMRGMWRRATPPRTKSTQMASVPMVPEQATTADPTFSETPVREHAAAMDFAARWPVAYLTNALQVRTLVARHQSSRRPPLRLILEIDYASACPLASRTMKQASVSSTDQGGGKRRGKHASLLRVILLKFDHDGERHMKIIKIIAAAASLLILAAVPASAQTAEAALKSADGKDVKRSS